MPFLSSYAVLPPLAPHRQCLRLFFLPPPQAKGREEGGRRRPDDEMDTGWNLMKISRRWRDPQPLFCVCNFQYISKIIQFIYLWKHIEFIRLYIVCAQSVNICHKKWQHITNALLGAKFSPGYFLRILNGVVQAQQTRPPVILCSLPGWLGIICPYLLASSAVCRHVTSNGNNMSGVVVLFMTARDEQESDHFPPPTSDGWGGGWLVHQREWGLVAVWGRWRNNISPWRMRTINSTFYFDKLWVALNAQSIEVQELSR